MSRRTRPSALSNRTELKISWALRDLPEDCARAVETWLDVFSGLSFEAWIAVGRAYHQDAAGRDRRATARTLLDAVIADQQLDVTAWLIQDMVETTTHPAAIIASRRRRPAKRDFAVARAAAESALLATAMEACLPLEDLDALRLPFLDAIGRGALRAV